MLQRAGARDFERADLLVGRDPVGVDGGELRNTELFGRLARRDLGLVHRTGTLDVAPSRLFLVDDARLGHGALLKDARLLDVLARRDLGFLDRASALDLLLAHLALRGDARLADRLLISDLRLLDLFARRDLGFLDRAGALDLALAHIALRGDARFADGALVRDARFLDLLARGELGLLSLGVPQRALAREFGALHRAAHFDVALLVEPRGLAFALDVERLPLGFEVAGADQDHRLLFDVVAQLAACLDLLDQLRQAFGIEAVRRVEVFKVGLVEVGDRHRLKLEAVLRQPFGSRLLHARDIISALLVHFLHRHLGRDGAQRGDELAGEERVQPLRLHGAAAERRGSDRDRFLARAYPHVEFGLDVDAHAVLGDQRVRLLAHDLHLQHVHVHGRVVVDERQHEGAAVDHHPLAEQTRAHEGHLLRGPVIEPVHQVDDDRDDDDRDDQPQDQLPNEHA